MLNTIILNQKLFIVKNKVKIKRQRSKKFTGPKPFLPGIAHSHRVEKSDNSLFASGLITSRATLPGQMISGNLLKLAMFWANYCYQIIRSIYIHFAIIIESAVYILCSFYKFLGGYFSQSRRAQVPTYWATITNKMRIRLLLKRTMLWTNYAYLCPHIDIPNLGIVIKVTVCLVSSCHKLYPTRSEPPSDFYIAASLAPFAMQVIIRRLLKITMNPASDCHLAMYQLVLHLVITIDIAVNRSGALQKLFRGQSRRHSNYQYKQETLLGPQLLMPITQQENLTGQGYYNQYRIFGQLGNPLRDWQTNYNICSGF